MDIAVVGRGCDKYFKILDVTKKVISTLKLDYSVREISNPKDMLNIGIVNYPALMINEKAVSQGKELSIQEVENLLKNDNRKIQ